MKGQVLLLREDPDFLGARQHFWRSLELAREHGALAWELRAAMSLHRLDLRSGDARESHKLLSHVYGQFREGFETADLDSAKRLLASA